MKLGLLANGSLAGNDFLDRLVELLLGFRARFARRPLGVVFHLARSAAGPPGTPLAPPLTSTDGADICSEGAEARRRNWAGASLNAR